MTTPWEKSPNHLELPQVTAIRSSFLESERPLAQPMSIHSMWEGQNLYVDEPAATTGMVTLKVPSN